MSRTAVWCDSKQHVLPESALGQHTGVQEWVTDSLQTLLLLLREATIQHWISKASLDFWNFKILICCLLLCSSSVALGVKVMLGQSSSKIQTELQSNSSKTVRTVFSFPFANQKFMRSQCRTASLMVVVPQQQPALITVAAQVLNESAQECANACPPLRSPSTYPTSQMTRDSADKNRRNKSKRWFMTEQP